MADVQLARSKGAEHPTSTSLALASRAWPFTASDSIQHEQFGRDRPYRFSARCLSLPTFNTAMHVQGSNCWLHGCAVQQPLPDKANRAGAERLVWPAPASRAWTFTASDGIHIFGLRACQFWMASHWRCISDEHTVWQICASTVERGRAFDQRRSSHSGAGNPVFDAPPGTHAGTQPSGRPTNRCQN